MRYSFYTRASFNDVNSYLYSTDINKLVWIFCARFDSYYLRRLYLVFLQELFPHADALVQYLNDFVTKLKLNVQFNTTISNIRKRDSADKLFHINDQNGNEYTCNTIIVATGIAKPNRIQFQGKYNIY